MTGRGVDLLALPGPTPPPPWRCRVSALLWWHRAAPAAAAALPEGLRGRRAVPLTVAAFVRYDETPVGPYAEVFAAPLLVAGAHGLPGVAVPFIAVDSVPSLRGGREHWGLPKALATFALDEKRGALVGATATGDGWSVRVTATARAPRLPYAAVLPATILLPDGRVATSLVRQRALGRLGRVDVEVAGPTLPSWLLPGRHRGLQVLRGRMVVGVPRG